MTLQEQQIYENNWAYEDIKSVHLELSTLCNSICPWCPRYQNFSPNVNPNITQGAWTLERFQDTFTVDFIKQIKMWTFAGDYGDPCTCPEILDILRYITKHNSKSAIQINTNGGMKTERFWHDLGKLFTRNKSRYVIFSVDGLEDTNHIYRRNVKWQKVFSAMTTYSQTGAKGIWEFLKFKHNEHQLEKAFALANKLGFIIRFKNPNGFEEDGMMPARDENYNIEYEIYPASDVEIRPVIVSPAQENLINMINTDVIEYDSVKDKIESFYKDKSACINCSAKTFGMGNEVRINYDGTVWPCSFFGHLSQKYLKDRKVSVVHKWQADNIFKDVKNNLKDKTLKEILDGDPFKAVRESWKDHSILLCSDSCSQGQTTMEKIYNA